MRDQNRCKSHRHTECNEKQHHGYTGYDVCIQHRDVGDTQHKGAELAVHALDPNGCQCSDHCCDQR